MINVTPLQPGWCKKHPTSRIVEGKNGIECLACYVSTLPQEERANWFPYMDDDDDS